MAQIFWRQQCLDTSITELPSPPDFELVEQFLKLDSFVVAEGRYNIPDLAAKEIRIGTDAVAVGSDITRVENITPWFTSAIVNIQKLTRECLKN